LLLDPGGVLIEGAGVLPGFTWLCNPAASRKYAVVVSVLDVTVPAPRQEIYLANSHFRHCERSPGSSI
jgi:hypothetical protein